MDDRRYYRVQRVYHGIALLTYSVIQETPCCYQLGYLDGIYLRECSQVIVPPELREHETWMVKNARCPWAHRTPEKALHAFLNQQKTRLLLLEGYVNIAKENIEMAQAELERPSRKEPTL